MSDAMYYVYYEDWLSEMVERSEDKAYVTLDSKTVMGIADYLRRSRENKPVVLCKDCKYAVPALNGFYEEGFKCANEHTPGYESFWWFRPNWFCAGGERKEE